ncbi:MAG: Mlc titration factor MtfA (ptsG expression regulator) [Paraglaciecola sp.]|jgi:Mlc titration factor MtfA (ptsG expression regulator)
MLQRLYKIWFQIFPTTVPSNWKLILFKHSDYYRTLSTANKKRFLQRLAILLKFMEFVPNGLPKILPEMKIVIGSAIIQMTFGHSRFLFKHFTKIYVMPRRYRFRNYDEPFFGHVDFKAKVICLSWEDVQKGFEIPDDAVNVALHEIAHAWEMEHQLSTDFEDIFIEKNLKVWQEAADITMKEIQEGKHHFLKKYGGKNRKEMFAVCVEAFFEQPVLFKTELPELYEKTVKLLRQNPLKKANPLEGF